MNTSCPETGLCPVPPTQSSRREFLVTGGKVVAASALSGVALPHVHAS